ncbi:Class I SAM-dependent methyltransferase [Candidatus Trichorickettsia mobilis]|uniref:Class I SAM-dependent methyltransferase n=1 Tax=Candidatus Trichorickettsia mobilis TaxID=1346319 RepID=A0ABZ0USQ6_9RICK|nr:class I SAM-dependent methyltransferase [Candidatus Trichorickettsia mobilis]WPY00551.1 Class I SAM-dependent methyltransferase [Candidatus Trichorickettsia mobilis]
MTKKNRKETKKFVKDIKAVQDQYLDYPYPLRDPEDEKKRLIWISGSYLGELNHWLYSGKESFRDGFRILVAGAGTGDAVIYFAEQLKDTNAQIVYLDFSKTSMDIAKERAKIRGLKNIKWVNDSILNIPNLKLGLFDHINCIGVLHHLEDPDLGLKILKDSLTEKGCMSLMVYATYGSTGVYHMQTLMQMVNKNATSRAEEVKNGWAIINCLPSSNWYVRGKDLMNDLTMGDVGMYDLFLHKQDRSYTIPELYDFVAKAGLHFIDFSHYQSRVFLRLENYITDQALLTELKKRDLVEQQAMCEIISGKIINHSFFVSKQKDTIASFDDLDNVPYFYTINGLAKQIYDYLEANSNLVGGSINYSWKSPVICDNLNVSLPVVNFTKYLFKYMISETLSFREIFNAIIAEIGEKIDDKLLIQNIKNTLMPFEKAGVLLLRHKNVDLFKKP